MATAVLASDGHPRTRPGCVAEPGVVEPGPQPAPAVGPVPLDGLQDRRGGRLHLHPDRTGLPGLEVQPPVVDVGAVEVAVLLDLDRRR